MSEKAKEVAERVADAILFHREDVRGRFTSSPNLDNKKVYKADDGGYIVKFWSDKGIFHNCWITARVEPDGLVTFNHCGDEGMNKLVKLVREDLRKSS